MSNQLNLSVKIRQEVFKRDRFTCQKCNFQDQTTEELEVHHTGVSPRVFNNNTINDLITLCSICSHYAPIPQKEFIRYLKKKVDGEILSTFRKSQQSISTITKKSMIDIFNNGNLVTRAPLGYKVINKQLVPAENSCIIQEIYQTYLNNNLSLTQLAKKYNLSVSGLKKVLTNQTYLGMLKFSGKITQGKHNSLISKDLFDKTQKKLRGV